MRIAVWNNNEYQEFESIRFKLEIKPNENVYITVYVTAGETIKFVNPRKVKIDNVILANDYKPTL